MTEENQTASGENQTDTSGAADQTTDSTQTTDPPKSDVVAYETHRKLLGEKKREAEKRQQAEAELEKYRTAEKEREEKKLQDNEEFQKLLAIREKERDEYKTKYEAAEARTLEARKLDAFLNTLDGKVDRKFWGHIDLEKVIIDPSTGNIDDMSVTKAVEEFKAEYPEIITTPGKGPGLPPESPKPGTGITYEQWLQLPVDEMKARYNEVQQQDKH